MANWKKFDEELPQEGEIILVIQQDDFYKDDKWSNSNYSPVRIMRFSKERYEREGEKPDQSLSDIDMYCYSVYWISANIPKEVEDVKSGRKKILTPYVES